MSFVGHHIRNVQAQLDQLHVTSLSSTTQRLGSDSEITSRLTHLQILLNSLTAVTTTEISKSHNSQISSILRHIHSRPDALARTESQPEVLEDELEWLILGKAAIQSYGIVLDALIRQTEPINDELWYWGDVLSSYRYTGLYSVQTSPLRLWQWSLTIWNDMKEREDVLTQSWRNLYDLAGKVIRERSVVDMQKRLVSPLALVRAEIRQKRNKLQQLKALNAYGLGYLLSNTFLRGSLENGLFNERDRTSPVTLESKNWKHTVSRSVQVLRAVLTASAREDANEEDFEQQVEKSMSNVSVATSTSPELAACLNDLQELLEVLLPKFQARSRVWFEAGQRPGWLIRYWLPVTALVLSSSTILRILVNRKEAIAQWISEFGTTVRDFWINWIVEPTKKVIGTIRHDESSEVSIMSKRSLEGDRESLERMVIDFATDNPGSHMDESQIADLRAKVREGDLTPVLRAYEKDLHSPFWGTIRGNLIRALLIQVQKTKVDVEIAMGGIDSLLKSQELVFGFVGLTPGILVSVGVTRWLRQASSDRRTYRSAVQQSQSYLTLRNIDRILTVYSKAGDATLSFKAYGLLVCEANALRRHASIVLPTNVFRQFQEDFDDLLDLSTNVEQQVRVVDRIRWAYSRWF